MSAAWWLPRVALGAVFIAASAFSFFESVYLRDQAAMFAEPRIGEWMWAFRAVSLVLILACVAVFVRR